MFIRFDMIHERNRQMDKQTDGRTPHADIGCAYASHRVAKSIRLHILPVLHCLGGDAF